MAKKKNKKIVKAPKTEEIAAATEVEVVAPDNVDTKAEAKKSKVENKKDKAKNKKTKKVNDEPKASVGKKCKEVFSELKKVSWPNFKTVVKNTGIVIVVVLVFTVILFGIDRGLAALYNLIPR